MSTASTSCAGGRLNGNRMNRSSNPAAPNLGPASRPRTGRHGGTYRSGKLRPHEESTQRSPVTPRGQLSVERPGKNISPVSGECPTFGKNVVELFKCVHRDELVEHRARHVYGRSRRHESVDKFRVRSDPSDAQSTPNGLVERSDGDHTGTLKVLKGLAEYLDMSLGDLIEGIVLHAFEGKAPFGAAVIAKIDQLREVYGMTFTAVDAHSLTEGQPG